MVFTIKHKLAFGFGFCMLLMGVIAWTNFAGLQKLEKFYQKSMKETSDMEQATDAKHIGAELYLVITNTIINLNAEQSQNACCSASARPASKAGRLP
jgi:hypothetical protein